MALIVLEGLDGAGKSTQVNKLQQMLASCGIGYEYLHFPRFDAPVYGELIARANWERSERSIPTS